MFTPAWARAALTHPVFTGLSKQHLANLIVELADPWTAAHQAALHRRRGHPRRRGAGAGPHQRLVFADRVLVTLVILRYQLPHQALAVLYGVDRATITRAVGEVRPLLAERGFAVPGLPGVRLRTLADVFAYAAAQGVELRIDGTETQVRRPRANRPGRRAFVSGKRKQNTIKTTTISDGQGRTLWAGAVRPGPDARPDRGHHRGHRGAAAVLPDRHGQGGHRLLGACQGVSRSGLRPATQTGQGCPGRGDRRLPAGTRPAVVPADLCRARHRRAQAVATPATLHRTPRGLRPNASGHRRPGLRPSRPPLSGYPNPPGEHTPTSIAHQVVTHPSRDRALEYVQVCPYGTWRNGMIRTCVRTLRPA